MIDAVIAYIRSWDFWIWFGFFAQFFFFLRFFAQWVATERARRIVIPGVFWHLSIVGGVLILIYSIVRRDIVFIAGSVLSLVIYFRNTWFHHRGAHRREMDDAEHRAA
ncbi:MAG: lipid-A-disaccharide synthase N-terminal domain-containing protein [bacterium]|nr:lipid-A-disaccharide synthase N-terminal domain-containing protein [bacterium]